MCVYMCVRVWGEGEGGSEFEGRRERCDRCVYVWIYVPVHVRACVWCVSVYVSTCVHGVCVCVRVCVRARVCVCVLV